MLTLSMLSFKNPLFLNIEIYDLRNSKGLLLLELQDEKKNFVKRISQEIVNNQCIIILDDLGPGKYTFKYFHDENNNKKMDTNRIGIPKEGFGFSNNAMGAFGPPSHKKMIFELKGDTTIKCTPIYFKSSVTN